MYHSVQRWLVRGCASYVLGEKRWRRVHRTRAWDGVWGVSVGPMWHGAAAFWPPVNYFLHTETLTNEHTLISIRTGEVHLVASRVMVRSRMRVSCRRKECLWAKTCNQLSRDISWGESPFLDCFDCDFGGPASRRCECTRSGLFCTSPFWCDLSNASIKPSVLKFRHLSTYAHMTNKQYVCGRNILTFSSNAKSLGAAVMI